ncbi:cell division protein FtsK [bacterium DOLZORAL124_64_63]|nr:MAG: cell division protein FtsK [bacterium DOLZORAL124_64_63]
MLLLAIAVYLGISLFGGVGPWWLPITEATAGDLVVPGNPGGPVGSYLSALLHAVFGAIWCWGFPLALGAVGLGFLFQCPTLVRSWTLRALPLWLATVSWIAQPGWLFGDEMGARLGGMVGFYIARGFHALFGPGGSPLFLTLILLVTLFLIFRRWLGWVGPAFRGLGRALAAVGLILAEVVGAPLRMLGEGFGRLPGSLAAWRQKRAHKRAVRQEERNARRRAAETVGTAGSVLTAEEEATREPRRHHTPPTPDESRQATDSETGPEGAPAPAENPEEYELAGATGEYMGEGDAPLPSGETESAPPRKKKKVKRARGPIVLPPVDLLTPADPSTLQVSTEELDAAADLLESTLRSFGVEGEVKDVRPGPVVTTYEFQPGVGIKVSQIVQRSDDLALAMRARSIRMEAPIPGKAAVGIEIPNQVAKMVRLREVLELVSGAQRKPLQVVLGKDVVGRPVSIDIASLPHLLVAGSTGSGKSVCLNAMISNLLLENDPSTLRMVMIDPKMLEMSVYNGIPHLLLPVVTDPKEALKAMQWMVAQMEYRYRTLAKHTVRNIAQYNEKVARGEIRDEDGDVVTEPMPYYLTIVDELADLMLQLGKDLEDLITRLAQKARAVGIHLILATQRPSVDVLTGVIKANIPCRIAFRVIQMNDSRTILDMKGAEKLLGHGDMLYLMPGRALPVRVHGSFIDIDECEAIVQHWLQYTGTTEEISLNEKPDGTAMHSGEDDLFDDAMRVVVQHQSGSTSLLQRRLRIGYTRAGRLMDMLEEAGVVGPFTGSKARDVLIGPEDLPEAQEGQA